MKNVSKILLLVLILSVLPFFGGAYVGSDMFSSDSVVVGQLFASQKTYEEGLSEGGQMVLNKLNKKLMDKGIIVYPIDVNLNISTSITHVYGFVKKINSKSFILDYDTSQFRDIEPERMSKKIVIDDATQYLRSIEVEGEELDELARGDDYRKTVGKPRSGGGISFVNDDEEEIIASEDYENIFFDDLKPGNYVQISLRSDLNSEGSVLASQIKVYPLTKNTYPDGEFPSYDDLPNSGGGLY